MRAVGYLFSDKGGLSGEPGLFYDYILGGNGLFIQAKSSLLKAMVRITVAEVRGLLPLEEKMELPMGRIPRSLYDLALFVLCADPQRERYLAVTWEGEYRLRQPPQEGSAGGVKYERLPGTVLDIHSHGSMSAFFSGTDNEDEQGLRLYTVVGKLDTMLPEVEMRVGIYGYFAPVRMEEIFE